MSVKVIRSDVLVVGSGAAGLMAAIKAVEVCAGLNRGKGASICVLEKAVLGKSGSTVGAEQIAAVGPWSPPEDSPDVHFRDSVIGGRFINNQALTRIMVDQAAARVADLERWGMRFDRDEDGNYVLADVGGHTHRRQLTFKGDRVGLGIVNTLRRRSREVGVKVHQDLFVIDLIVRDGTVVGITAVDLQHGKPLIFQGKATVLATGGAGQLYPITSNSGMSTGDGFAMALRAGVPLMDMEQVQFYPTGLVYPPSLRGIGVGVLPSSKMFNCEGERFMSRYDPENIVVEPPARQTVLRDLVTERAG